MQVVSPPTAQRTLGFGLALLVVGAAIVSLVESGPQPLPGVALGSTVLLHVERSVATFALTVAVATVLRDGVRGRLPNQLSTAGLAYESPTATDAQAVRKLQVEIELLRAQVTNLSLDRGRGRR